MTSFSQKLLVVVLLVAGLAGFACSEDDIDKGEGTIIGTIDYQGDLIIKRVGVAVFDVGNNPPLTMPVNAQFIPVDVVEAGVDFPIQYEIKGLDDGQYWIQVYGDVDTGDGMGMQAPDPRAPFVGPIEVVGVDQTLDMVMVDPGDIDGDADGDLVEGEDEIEFSEDVVPDNGKSAIYGVIDYDGEKTGTLIIVGFDTNPASGMPVLYTFVDDPVFPTTYQYTSVKPMTMYIMAYLDVDASDGMTNMPVDPISTNGELVEYTFTEGESYRIDFTLEELE